MGGPKFSSSLTSRSTNSAVLIQVTVNPKKCMANQVCVRAAPDIFQLGTAGYSRLAREVGLADLDMLRDAAENCPTGSITVEVLGDV